MPDLDPIGVPPSVGEKLRADSRQVERTRRDAEMGVPVEVPDFILATLTARDSSSGYYSWTQDAPSSTGRYSQPNGLSGTHQWSPAIAPNGETIAVPYKCQLRRLTNTPTLGTLWEVIATGNGSGGGSTSPTFSGAAVYSDTAQTIGASSVAVVTYNQTIFDTGSYFNGADGFSIPQTGYYLVGAYGEWGASGSVIWLYEDGIVQTVSNRGPDTGVLGSTSFQVLRSLTAGTVLRVLAQNTAIVANNISNGAAASPQKRPQFWITRLGN